MKIVIDISEEEYNECKNRFNMVFQDGYLNYNLNTALTMYVALGKPIEERPTAEWILSDNQREEDIENDNYCFICSECQFPDIHAKSATVPYCPNCGARMRGDE